MQESLTPKEREQAHEVNALGLPVTIQLEDQMIPLPASYATAGPEEGSSEGAEGNSLWRSDTDGDLAKWLNNGFTPRAPGRKHASLSALWKSNTFQCTGGHAELTCRAHMQSSHAELTCRCTCRLALCVLTHATYSLFCPNKSMIVLHIARRVSCSAAWLVLLHADVHFTRQVHESPPLCIEVVIYSCVIAGVSEEEPQKQRIGHSSPMRSQSFINNQQRQLLHKLFMKGTSQQQVMSDTGQQGMYFQQQAQQPGFDPQLPQSQQYMQQQQQQQGAFGGLSTQSVPPAFKCGRSDLQQQQAYHITAQAYDSNDYGRQQYVGTQMQGQHQPGVLTRGQSWAYGQPGVLTRGQSFVNGHSGVLTRGQSFANGQFSLDQGLDGCADSPKLEVLVTPNFSSQELNMLLEV